MTDMTRSDESEFFMNDERVSGKTVIRKAADSETDSIFLLLECYTDKGLLLPLTKDDIASRIDSFAVALVNGRCVGCSALRDFGNNLYEIRSLAVDPTQTGGQIGSKLVQFLIDENIPSGSRIFALTYRTSFFERLGFSTVSKALFPEKIWHDCEQCPKKEHCDEQAVMMTLP